MASQRQLVLRCFKNLHRTSQSVFQNDTATLQVVRLKINEEFAKHKNVTNEVSINEMCLMCVRGCDSSKKAERWPRTSRSDDMIERVEVVWRYVLSLSLSVSARLYHECVIIMDIN
ncbi:Complex 1 LYR protein [Trinorchestia longiramus]|nr:Complex 1 LYR protein [Trinorchestia longiramus]